MLERLSTALVCVDIWSRRQCKIGVTIRSSTKDASLVVIRSHSFTGVSKGDLSNSCTSASEEIVILLTATISDAAVSSGCLGVTGPVSIRAAPISAAMGVAKSWTFNQSALTFAVVGRIPR